MLLTLYCLVRHGLLASYAMIQCRSLIETLPLSHAADARYSPASHVSLALLVGVLWPLLREERVTAPRSSS